MKTIKLNDQQVQFIKDAFERIEQMGLGKTSVMIMNQIIIKLENNE